MSRLGMLIRVTARAVLIEREANFVDPGVLRVLFVVLITGAVPPILVGPSLSGCLERLVATDW